jgi:hypothetical protein
MKLVLLFYFMPISPLNLSAYIHLALLVLQMGRAFVFQLIQSDQQESKSEQALQIIGHVVAKSYAHKRSKHGRRQFMVSNAT